MRRRSQRLTDFRGHDTYLAEYPARLGIAPGTSRASGRSSIVSAESPILRGTENGENGDDREHERGGEIERGGCAAHRVLDLARERRHLTLQASFGRRGQPFAWTAFEMSGRDTQLERRLPGWSDQSARRDLSIELSIMSRELATMGRVTASG